LELGQATFAIGDDEMIMVAHAHEAVQLDAMALAGEREQVLEDPDDLRIWTEEEAALGATTGDQVRAVWQDATWGGHGWLSAVVPAACTKKDSRSGGLAAH
jgi:hypothetical protein